MPDYIRLEDLEAEILHNNPGAETELVKKAYFLAREIHKGATRDEGAEYFTHPCRVAWYLTKIMKVGEARVIAAALLHDVLEDGEDMTSRQLEEIFGSTVACYVSYLTKPPKNISQKFIDRTERNFIYHTQLEEAPLEVILIKLADRLDNIRSIHLSPLREKRDRYVKDTAEFYLPLARAFCPTIAGEIEAILSRLTQKEAPGGWLF